MDLTTKNLKTADILLSGTTQYNKKHPEDIIPVPTFASSRVNRSSLPDLIFSQEMEETEITIQPGEKYLRTFRNILTKEQPELQEKLIITATSESEGEMIFHYEDDDQGNYLRHSEFEIVAEENSHLTIFLVQRMSEQSDSRCLVRVICHPKSEVRVIIADSGGKTHRLDLRADIGERALFDCQGIYFGRGNEKYDYNYNLVHHGILCNSNLLVNGALKDYAAKVFRGTIDFRRGSSGSVGNESEYVTLLDDTVSNIAIPLLLCTEDNVEGNHAASAGRLNQDMVFYVMSRGFSEKEANKLIIASRFSHVLDLLPDSDLKDAVLTDILQKLDEG